MLLTPSSDHPSLILHSATLGKHSTQYIKERARQNTCFHKMLLHISSKTSLVRLNQIVIQGIPIARKTIHMDAEEWNINTRLFPEETEF